jgi:hypothetical protein
VTAVRASDRSAGSFRRSCPCAALMVELPTAAQVPASVVPARLTVETAVFELVHAELVVQFCCEPSEKLQVAVKFTAEPTVLGRIRRSDNYAGKRRRQGRTRQGRCASDRR